MRSRPWVFFLLPAILIWISADLSRFLSVPSSANTSAVWPPLGIALAAAWVFGRRWLMAYPLVVGAWFATHGYAPSICLLFMAEQGFELFAMTELHRRYVGERDFLSSLAGALRFYGYVAVLALLPAAAALAFAYHQLGYFGEQPYVGVWLFQWLPEAIGVILFAPPMQRFFDWCQTPERPKIDPWAALFALLFGLVLLASLAFAAHNRYNYARGLDYLFFPLLIAMALTGYVRSALLALPIAVICTLLGVYLGTWTTSHQAWNALGEGLSFAGVLAIMTQLVMATTIERTGLIASLRDANHHDALTGELNRAGLVDYVRRTDIADTHHYMCLTLCLRDFVYSRELLPVALVDACERWTLAMLRDALIPVAEWAALARLDQGIYTAVVAYTDIHAVDSQVRRVAAAIKGRIFRSEDWEYQVDVTIGGLPFANSDAIEDVITASRYTATDMTRRSVQTVHFDAHYQAQLADQRAELRRLEQLKQALENNRFQLFGQQIRPLGNRGARHKIELLLRMVGPGGDWISPGQFMPVANRFDYMVPLDRWVIRQAFTDIAARADQAARYDQFSINLSGSSLSHSETSAYVRNEIKRSGLPASLFCFEVTETEAIHDWDVALTILEELKTAGFAISLDDFGTGLATFDYLNRFDFDYLKIDGSFIRTLDTNVRNREVVEAMVLVARRRSIRTIAEFVENDAIAAQLRTLDVDFMQGFGLHRPEPLSGLLA
ncbi:EAL domain-containing protein [Salinisphaera sp. LB1]|uniref:sensor domain-containing phosphodiesterase n=1 Tax=Salinisphaera sp. LB1 TaxID=2183911 RepID=UPI000D7EB640|nr:EAL domain-containing protein [Salinisphaera sp. LB1]AWN17718.1 diguanylate cyclase/phosphodiesterase (GGDEF & EAL domains) with PAS/PAC sensor(s) [Salinisphaera sp. LB1]